MISSAVGAISRGMTLILLTLFINSDKVAVFKITPGKAVKEQEDANGSDKTGLFPKEVISMKKAVQIIRMIAVAAGILLILSGIISNVWSYFSMMNLYSQQGTSNPSLLPALFSGISSSIFFGLLPILLALFVNLDKVVQLFNRRPEKLTEAQSDSAVE